MSHIHILHFRYETHKHAQKHTQSHIAKLSSYTALHALLSTWLLHFGTMKKNRKMAFPAKQCHISENHVQLWLFFSFLPVFTMYRNEISVKQWYSIEIIWHPHCPTMTLKNKCFIISTEAPIKETLEEIVLTPVIYNICITQCGITTGQIVCVGT